MPCCAFTPCPSVPWEPFFVAETRAGLAGAYRSEKGEEEKGPDPTLPLVILESGRDLGGQDLDAHLPI